MTTVLTLNFLITDKALLIFVDSLLARLHFAINYIATQAVIEIQFSNLIWHLVIELIYLRVCMCTDRTKLEILLLPAFLSGLRIIIKIKKNLFNFYIRSIDHHYANFRQHRKRITVDAKFYTKCLLNWYYWQRQQQ